MKKILGIMVAASLFAACNNSAEEVKENEDSINKSSLDNRDVNNRNTSIYDSTQLSTKDTSSYERMPGKTDSLPR